MEGRGGGEGIKRDQPNKGMEREGGGEEGWDKKGSTQ